MFGLIKKVFIVVLSSIVNASNHTKCVSFSNQKCIIQLTLMKLHPNGYNEEFHYYPFAVKLGRYIGNCNTLNDLSNKVCILNKTEDLDRSVFKKIIGINESKTLTKHLSCECKCRFDGENVIVKSMWNNDKCQCECKKHHICKKDYVWNPATCICENPKCLASIMDDSATIEVIKSYDEEIKTIPKNFNEKM